MPAADRGPIKAQEPEAAAIIAIAADSYSKVLVPGPPTGVMTTSVSRRLLRARACWATLIAWMISGVVSLSKKGWAGDTEWVLVI